LSSVDIVPNLVFAYTDDQYSDLNEPAALLLPSYSTIDLSVAISDKDDRYRVTLVGRNLTDESYLALATTANTNPTTAGAPRLQIPRDAERYFGVEVRANFGGGR
jgi:iron complex outermembrane receptor protein